MPKRTDVLGRAVVERLEVLRLESSLLAVVKTSSEDDLGSGAGASARRNSMGAAATSDAETSARSRVLTEIMLTECGVGGVWRWKRCVKKEWIPAKSVKRNGQHEGEVDEQSRSDAHKPARFKRKKRTRLAGGGKVGSRG
jgi:hypothetical protein